MLSEALKRIALAKQNQMNQSIKTETSVVTSSSSLEEINIPSNIFETDISHLTHLFDKELNKEQELAVKLALSGESFVLTGAAGTGKTTTMKAVFTALSYMDKLTVLGSSHKYLNTNGPNVSISAYTRRATNNIKNNLPDNLKNNAITIHKLLAYAPVEEPGYNKFGELTMKRVFRPGYNSATKLPSNLNLIVLEEASMISVELYNQIEEALSRKENVQFIFLGDINQLGPIAGDAILGFKLVDLPCVNLHQVYRQALESPIIRLAHRILSGKIIKDTDFNDWNESGKLKLGLLPDSIKDPEDAWVSITGIHSKMTEPKGLKARYLSGDWDPKQDAIILPFRKTSMGVDHFSKALASMIDSTIPEDERQIIHEIITGKGNQYFSEGDLVLYEKERYTITKIVLNGNYSGTKQPRKGMFDRFGNEIGIVESEEEIFQSAEEALAAMEKQWEAFSEGEEAKREASHRITLTPEFAESDDEAIELSSSGAISKINFAYAITGHESQGLEFRRVYTFITHATLTNFVTREWLYTVVTRAKETLTVYGCQGVFNKGIIRQQIPGTSLSAKRAYFVRKKTQKISESPLTTEE